MSISLKLYRIGSWLFGVAALVAFVRGELTLGVALLAIGVAMHSYAYTDPDRRRARHRRPRR